MMLTRDLHPATFVPRDIQTAIQRSLERSDEVVWHTVALVDRDNLTNDFNPEQPWYWLVVTSRQLSLLPHDDGSAAEVHPLSFPISSILGIETGSVLLKTWITIYVAAMPEARPETGNEPWYVVGKDAVSAASGDEVLIEKRVEFHYSTMPAVQAAVRSLITTRPHLVPHHRDDEPVPATPNLLMTLEPALRPMVKALLAEGEDIRAVIFAPPGGASRGRKRRLPSGDENTVPRAWRGVAVTDRRVLLLELPVPIVPDGLRYATRVTQVAPDAIQMVTVPPAHNGVVDMQVLVQRDGAVQLWHIELDAHVASRWSEGVATLEETVRIARLPTHTEYQRFVAATGLHDIVLSNPAHYAALLKQIKEHRYYLGEHGRTTTMLDAARDWYRSLYGPITAQLTARETLNGTPADMYMRLCEYKWLASERLGADIGFDLALQAFQYWVA